MEEMNVVQVADVKDAKAYVGTVPIPGGSAVVMLMLPIGMQVHKIEFDISAEPDPVHGITPVPMSVSTPPLPDHILHSKSINVAGRACPLLMWVPMTLTPRRVETHITGGTELPALEGHIPPGVQPCVVVFDEAGEGYNPPRIDYKALNNLVQNTRHTPMPKYL